MASLANQVCRKCRAEIAVYRSLRAFTTTTTQSAIPPEAPNFVDVPQSHQFDLLTPRRQKGILPVPRKIFPPRQPDKPSEDYIARATRDKQPKNVVPESKMSDLGKYHNRLAVTRKRHLREGLLELHRRKESMTRQVAIRSEQKKMERERLISQPERVDERLTNASVPQSLRPKQGVQLSKGDVERRVKTKKAKLEKQTAEKQEERRDALHTLYMNARNFITTEGQLDAEIEKAFPAGPNPEWQSDVSRGESLWNTGAPPTIADLLDAGSQRVRKDFTKAGLENSAEKFRIDQERMKRIAEELSGGKI